MSNWEMYMNWDAIGAVGEVVGAIAVVVTLIFLTVQLKRNTKSIKAATRSQFAETISNTIANLQDKDFADVVTKGMSSPDSLNSSENLRFGSFVLRLIRTFEDAYFQSLDGDYDQVLGNLIGPTCSIYFQFQELEVTLIPENPGSIADLCPMWKRN